MINYSIIIPHKNTPELLRKCLDSIPRRDDIQIIVVDDNSDADKVDFEHFPGMGEPHTEVYLTKEGKGAGYARNVGLEHAKGKWILFLDSDDFFHECVSELMDKCIDNGADVVFFKADSINLADGTDGHRGDEYTERVDFALKNKDYQRVLMYSCPWGKMISSDFLKKHGIKFNEVRYGNDVVFMAKVALCSEKYDAVDLTAYCISASNGSLTSVASSSLIRLDQELESCAIIKKKFDLSRKDKYWLFFSWFGAYRQNKLSALIRWPKMFFMLGVPFLLDTCDMLCADMKNKLKRNK